TAKFSFLGSEEEPEMIFDWVDTERKGRLSLEEFSAGLRNIFGSSPSTHRLRRRKPLSSKRGSMTTSLPALEEANPQEKELFFAFLEQLGASHLPPEQAEIWQLWGKLRQEEPQLAGNLEGFLAKMNSRLQEVRADKEALELTMRKRDADHQREVQQLYEEMEQQIRQEKQQMQAESYSRSLALDSQMQEALEAKEREVRQLAEGQRELEAQLHSLSSTNLEVTSENQQLREAERDLVGQLEEVKGQLRETKGHLHATRGLVSWQMEEEPRQVAAILGLETWDEKALDPQTVFSEEAPLPGLFGDNDDWAHLLNRFSSPPHSGLQVSWSPPPTPSSHSGPQTSRVVRQISISDPQFLLLGQEPASDPDGAPGSLPGASSRANKGKGVDSNGQDTRPEQPVGESLECTEESGFGTEAHLHWSLPGAPTEESGGLAATALKGLIPLEEGPPPHVNVTGSREHFQASHPDDTGLSPGPIPAKPPRQREALHRDMHTAGPEPGLGSPEAQALTPGLAEPSQDPAERSKQRKPGPDMQAAHPGARREAHGQILRPDGLAALPSQGLEEKPRAEERKGVDGGGRELSSEQAGGTSGLRTGHLELPQQDAMAAPLPPEAPQTWAEAESSAPGESSPFRSSPHKRAQSENGARPLELTGPLPAVAEMKAQPRSPPTTSHREGEQGPPHSRESGAVKRPEDPGRNSGKTELPPSPEAATASVPLADPDHIFHVIFLGDSNVGKTSFLHLLHHNSFATGLTATVGVDFRVKNLLVDNKCFALQLWDTAGQERYHSVTRQLFHKADGVVLMYDITSQESFTHVRYWLDCLQDAGCEGAVILLLGNKIDCEEERQVPTTVGEQLAQELGVSFAECSAALGHNILEPMMNLARMGGKSGEQGLFCSEEAPMKQQGSLVRAGAESTVQSTGARATSHKGCQPHRVTGAGQEQSRWEGGSYRVQPISPELHPWAPPCCPRGTGERGTDAWVSSQVTPEARRPLEGLFGGGGPREASKESWLLFLTLDLVGMETPLTPTPHPSQGFLFFSSSPGHSSDRERSSVQEDPPQ
ncbi:Ras-related protein Rab-44, partial [Galemys pyrenaicus]